MILNALAECPEKLGGMPVTAWAFFDFVVETTGMRSKRMDGLLAPNLEGVAIGLDQQNTGGYFLFGWDVERDTDTGHKTL